MTNVRSEVINLAVAKVVAQVDRMEAECGCRSATVNMRIHYTDHGYVDGDHGRGPACGVAASVKLRIGAHADAGDLQRGYSLLDPAKASKTVANYD